MTTRMSEDEFTERLKGTASTQAAYLIAVEEASRARSEEARLLDEAKAKDERIKALEAMLGRVAACRKSVESSNWGGEDLLSDIDALIAKVSP